MYNSMKRAKFEFFNKVHRQFSYDKEFPSSIFTEKHTNFAVWLIPKRTGLQSPVDIQYKNMDLE